MNQVMTSASIPDRIRGAAAGLAIASVFVATGLVGSRPDGADAIFSQAGWPSLVAGTLGGWLLAPRAVRARSRGDWAGVVVLLALLAVVIGALGIGASMGIEAALRPGADPSGAIPSVLSGIFLGALGIVLLGWMVLPLTSVAALLWAVVMARFARPRP